MKEKTGENLRRIRKARKMSMDKLAKMVGTTFTTIANHEKKGITSIKWLITYSEVLGCDPADLLSESADASKYEITEDIANIYPWNLALMVMIGSNTEEEKAKKHDELYRVYVPALLDAVNELTDRERDILEMRYKHGMILEQCGKRFGVTKERVRQIEAKAIRKLRHPRYAKTYIMDTYGKAVKLQFEVERLKSENEDLRHLLDVRKGIEEEKPVVSIDEMELSVRAYNCLKRAGIDTLDDIRGLTIERLVNIRNLGRKSAKEVIAKAKEYGIIIPYEESY